MPAESLGFLFRMPAFVLDMNQLWIEHARKGEHPVVKMSRKTRTRSLFRGLVPEIKELVRKQHSSKATPALRRLLRAFLWNHPGALPRVRPTTRRKDVQRLEVRPMVGENTVWGLVP